MSTSNLPPAAVVKKVNTALLFYFLPFILILPLIALVAVNESKSTLELLMKAMPICMLIGAALLAIAGFSTANVNDDDLLSTLKQIGFAGICLAIYPIISLSNSSSLEEIGRKIGNNPANLIFNADNVLAVLSILVGIYLLYSAFKNFYDGTAIVVSKSLLVLFIAIIVAGLFAYLIKETQAPKYESFNDYESYEKAVESYSKKMAIYAMFVMFGALIYFSGIVATLIGMHAMKRVSEYSDEEPADTPSTPSTPTYTPPTPPAAPTRPAQPEDDGGVSL